MTIHAPRDAETVQGVVTKIVTALGGGDLGRGVDAAVAATGKAAGTVRKWTVPSQECEPGLSSAVALDALYYRVTGLDPPLLRFYAERVSGATGGAHGAVRYDLWRELANLHVASGAVPAAVQSATHPDGPGGPSIVPVEMAAISGVVDRAKDAADRVAAAARAAMKDGWRG